MIGEIEMFSKGSNTLSMLRLGLRGVVGRCRRRFAVQGVHVEGFLVEGGSLVYVPAGRVHEVPKVIQEHRMQEARMELLRGMARH